MHEKLKTALGFIKQNQYTTAEALLVELVASAHAQKNRELKVLAIANLGLLYRKMGEFKKALAQYQLAGKLMPQDVHLKLAEAQMLIELKQFKIAETKLKKLVKHLDENDVLLHQVHTSLGLIYWKLGLANDSLSCFFASVPRKFVGMITAANINLKLLECFFREKFALMECYAFLRMALHFAEANKEKSYATIYHRILEGLKVVKS